MLCPEHKLPPFGEGGEWPCILCWLDAPREPVVRTIEGPLTYADANDDDGET